MGKKGGKSGGDRDSGGRFQKGHSIPGPGNPISRRINEYRRELHEAVDEKQAARILKGFADLAEESPDPYVRIAAGRVVIERTAGKPKEPGTVVPEGLFQQVAEITDAESARAASRAVAGAMMAGKIEVEVAQMMLGCLKSATDHELDEILARLDRLEEGAA